MTEIEKIDKLILHIRNVQESGIILGKKLINNGETELGRQLIANCMIHDASKFNGIEWNYIIPDGPLKKKSDKFNLKLAIQHHQKINPHHPEYWQGGIHGMPLLYLIELCCDWKARSEEFGSSLIDFIDKQATKIFNFNKNDEVYKNIMKYIELICEKPFENLNK